MKNVDIKTIIDGATARATGKQQIYIVVTEPGEVSTMGFSCSQCGATGNGNSGGSVAHRSDCPYA